MSNAVMLFVSLISPIMLSVVMLIVVLFCWLLLFLVWFFWVLLLHQVFMLNSFFLNFAWAGEQTQDLLVIFIYFSLILLLS